MHRRPARPLRLYSDRALAAKPWPTMLAAIWGFEPANPDDPRRSRFDLLRARATDLFEEAALADCDYCVLPFDFGAVMDGSVPRPRVEAFLSQAAAAGKTTLSACWHDYDPGQTDSRQIIWQTGFEPRRGRAGARLLPCMVEDFVETYHGGALPVRSWRARPVVGFCGRADTEVHGPARRTREWARRLKRCIRTGRRTYPYRQLRAHFIQAVQRDDRLEGNFDIKGGFYGRDGDSMAGVSPEERARARADFVGNLANSDYSLCARGAGNFSIRFYETLSAGRIPLYVDTGAPLPFEDQIDWDRYLVRVRPRDARRVADILLAFHERHRGRFAELQHAIRDLWREYLEPYAYHARIVEELLGEAGAADARSDVEGAEVSVLRGMQQFVKTPPRFSYLVEITPRWLEKMGTSAAELFSFMANFRYVHALSADGWTRRIESDPLTTQQDNVVFTHPNGFAKDFPE